MDRLYLMSTFVAVVDAGGFAGAARKLQVSPPAVTRAIAELETRLGVQLLTRTTRMVRVTDAGARYVEDCRRIIAEADDADEAAAGVDSRVKGHLVVTAPALFGPMHVSPVVTRYLREHPETTVSCWFMDRVAHMMDEGVDVAIRIAELPDSGLHARRVGEVRQVLCASPAYLASNPPIAHPRDLTSQTTISSSSAPATSDWRFVGEAGPFEVSLEPRLITTSNHAAIAAALEGFGVARLMSYQAEPHVLRGDLRPILTEFAPPAVPVHVVHREGRRASNKVRVFVDLAVKMLSESRAISGSSPPAG